MPNFYEISPTSDTVNLHQNTGSVSFGVRYVGNRQVTARAIATPMEGAQAEWLVVEPPSEAAMAPGQTRTFTVSVTIPPATPPGRYGYRLDVVSLDNPDEEYDQGPLVTFDVEREKTPQPATAQLSERPLQVHVKHHTPKWAIAWFIFVALLAITVFGVALWWVIQGFNNFSGQLLGLIAATKRPVFGQASSWRCRRRATVQCSTRAPRHKRATHSGS